MRIVLCLALLGLLQACAAIGDLSPQDAVPAALTAFGDSSRFGTRPDIRTPEELHRLTPAQEADFLAWFHDPARAHIGSHERLFRYLQMLTQGFQYQGETLTASEALATHSGNCLSLAILTTALAHMAGIEVAHQLMDDQPVFEFQGSVVKKGVHVSTLVYDSDWKVNPNIPGDRPRGWRIDFFPSLKGRFIANLTATEYLALYYSNIAADAIGARDYRVAYWNSLEALRHAPDHGASLNMLAVVNRRVGDLATAEAIYLYGIERAHDKLSLLKNYHALLISSGRDAEATLIQNRLDGMDDPSPFHWLQLARESHSAGDWDAAIRYYRRALALAPYLHEAHLGLAQSYHASGQLRRAASSLEDAAGFAPRVSTRTLYEAKLAALRHETGGSSH
jgi:tetratricopeptide (TPR) repeat protein